VLAVGRWRHCLLWMAYINMKLTIYKLRSALHHGMGTKCGKLAVVKLSGQYLHRSTCCGKEAEESLKFVVWGKVQDRSTLIFLDSHISI